MSSMTKLQGAAGATFEVVDTAGVASIKLDGTTVMAGQQSAIADHAAITAYSAHASGATTVTSNAATDLDTTAAGLATAVAELTTLRAKVNAIIAALEAAGIIAS